MELTIGQRELVVITAVMVAIAPISVDSLLTGLPLMAIEFGLSQVTYASLVLTVFLIGVGAGTFVAGPLSDSFGRRTIGVAGLGLFVLGAVIAAVAPTFEVLLAARLLQGLGAAGPRVVAIATLRDLHAGRDMARILSLVMMIFMILPALAPAFGATFTWYGHWRLLFVALALFGLALVIWYATRLPETRLRPDRAPFRLRSILEQSREMFQHPQARLSVILQTFVITSLLTTIATIQPIFDDVYDRAMGFPFWFGAVILAAAVSSLINARLVMRMSMWQVVGGAMVGQVILSAVLIAHFAAGGAPSFPLFLVWLFGLMIQVSFCSSNLNAMATEPMGQSAGLAASMISGVSTLGGAVLASGLSQLYDGSILSVATVVLTLSASGLLLMGQARAPAAS